MKNDPNAIAAIVPFLDDERLMRLVHEINNVMDYVTDPENIDNYASMLLAVTNSGTLGAKEETRLRAILSRGIITKNDGIVIYTPDSTSTVDADAFYDEIRTWINHNLQTVDIVEVRAAYDKMASELVEPRTLPEALDVLTVIYHFIDRESGDMIASRYPKLIPMLNYILAYIQSISVDVNAPKIKNVFNSGRRKLRSVVKVQGFLDSHHDSLIIKPRLL